jgi:CO/xanthine dehydrogenase Mo-binding subunit
MRCPGELQAVFASESHVDLMADAIGVDPLEFRRRNAVRPGSISSHHERIRDPRALEVIDRLAALAPRDLPAGRGFGVAVVARRMEGGRQQISARIVDGRVEFTTGLPDQGSGVETVIARVAAAVLGRPIEGIEIRRATTASASPDLGVGASRVTLLISRATEDAARRLIAALEGVAGEAVGRVVHHSPTGFRTDDDVVAASWADAATIAERRGLVVTGSYDSTEDLGRGVADFTFAGLGVTVEVDRETGSVTLHDPIFVADAGTVISPVAHAGQIDGGFAQGLGAALMEELTIEEGQVLSLSLAEYRLPAAPDVPMLRTVLLPVSPGAGAFGAKMAGELSPSCVAPAIANGIARAVGARLRTIPMTPERILRELRDPTD